MKRFGGLLVVVLCAAAMAGCDSGGATPTPQGGSTSSTRTPAPTTPTATPTVSADDAAATMAGQGLTRILQSNPLAAKADSVRTDSCLLGSLATYSEKVDGAAKGRTATFDNSRYTIQRYNGFGDQGLALGCTRRAGSSIVFGISATTHAKAVPATAVKGFAAPATYRGGTTYSKIDDRSLCSVYWVPPVRSYVLSVVFRTKTTPTAAQCRKGFAAVAPALVTALSKQSG